MDKIKGFKTVILGTIFGVVLILKGWTSGEVAADAPTMETVEGAYNAFEIVWGFIVMFGTWINRVFTSSRIFKKE